MGRFERTPWLLVEIADLLGCCVHQTVACYDYIFMPWDYLELKTDYKVVTTLNLILKVVEPTGISI